MSETRVTTVEQWQEACSSAFVPLRVRDALPAPAGSPRFRAHLDLVQLPGGVSVAGVASSASEVYRSAGVIAEHPRDDVLLSLQLSGTGSVLQDGREARLRPGQAALYDASHPYSLRFAEHSMSEVVLQAPRRLLPRSGQAMADLTARPLPRSAGLTALANLMASVNAGGAATVVTSEPGRREAELIAEALTTLLRAVLLPTARPATAGLDGEQMRAVLKAHLDEHFTDPSLSVQSLAATHHVSLRQVHKLFAELGESPGSYLRTRRLAHAHALLLDGESVTTATHRNGFQDSDTFSRAFRRHYGVSPSEVLHG